MRNGRNKNFVNYNDHVFNTKNRGVCMPSEKWTTTQKEIMKSYQNEQFKDKNGRTFEVPVNDDGSYQKFEVYRIPTEHLIYNFDNIRLKIEKKKKEQELGIKLNPENKEHNKIIENLLFTSKIYSAKASKTMVSQLDKQSGGPGQIDPLYVAVDGVVWNGNRRLSVNNHIAEDPASKNPSYYKKIDAIFLPPMEIHDLRKLERRLQATKDYKEDYGKLQKYLQISDDAKLDSDWSLPELIESFNGEYTSKDITKIQQVVSLMEEFLEFINRSDDWLYIYENGGIEMWETVNTTIQKEIKKSAGDPTDPTPDIVKQQFFVELSEGTYQDARSLSRILKTPLARENLVKNSNVFKNPEKFSTYDKKLVKREKQVVERASEIEKSSQKNPIDVLESLHDNVEKIEDDRIPPSDKIISIINSIRKRLDEIEKLAKK